METPNTPPKHEYVVEKNKISDVLANWAKLAEGHNFQLSIEENEDGNYVLHPLPFKTVQEEAPDGEVWLATITTDCTDDELLENEFVRDRYIRPVKRLAEVSESVVLLCSRQTRGTKFMLQAASNCDLKPTSRTRAALRGFTAQLRSWFRGKAEENEDIQKLIREAEDVLEAAINSVG